MAQKRFCDLCDADITRVVFTVASFEQSDVTSAYQQMDMCRHCKDELDRFFKELKRHNMNRIKGGSLG